MSFFNAEQLRYELRVRRAGRWEIREIVDDPLDAALPGGRATATTTDLQTAETAIVSRARRAMTQAGVEAVTLVRTRTRNNGFQTETVLFSEERTGKSAGVGSTPIILGTLDGPPPPPCTQLEELCARPAYRAAGQILRSFLERSGITAFELFHHAPHQRTLEENRTLVPGAIERVARLQAGADAGALPAHKERLTSLVNGLRTAAARLADRALPALSDDDFAAMATAAGAGADPAAAMFRVGAAFSRSLARNPGMAHRLNVVGACLARPMEPTHLAILDSFTACVFDDPAATLKLMGGNTDRAATLCGLAELASGTRPASSTQTAAIVLAAFIAGSKLPLTAASLWDRIRRDLERGEPLSQFEPADERQKLASIRTRVLPAAPDLLKPALEAALRRRAEQLRQAALGNAFG